MDTTKYVDELWNKNIVECLDAIKEADEALETINRDMFNDISYVSFEITCNGGDINTVKRVLKNFEKRYKREREVKHMPGSYRSAKSVVLNAIRAGVELADGYEVKGKTALEREIKQSSTRDTINKKKADTLVWNALHCLSHVSGEVQDSDELAANLAKIEDYTQLIRETYL